MAISLCPAMTPNPDKLSCSGSTWRTFLQRSPDRKHFLLVEEFTLLQDLAGRGNYKRNALTQNERKNTPRCQKWQPGNIRNIKSLFTSLDNLMVVVSLACCMSGCGVRLDLIVLLMVAMEMVAILVCYALFSSVNSLFYWLHSISCHSPRSR